MKISTEPAIVAKKQEKAGRLLLNVPEKGPARLAADRLTNVAKNELHCRIDVCASGEGMSSAGVTALCPPWGKQDLASLREADVPLLPDGRIAVLAEAKYGEQGFIAARINDNQRLLLAANTQTGLKHALLTLGDRLYRDPNGNVAVDPFDGVHKPAFECRHIKTDAMNCGPFRARFGYWDPTCQAGVDDFADWLASFRITDYDLLAFVRGWGMTYASERFPLLTDPQHPNSETDFYPRLLERLHEWGMKVWASDIYIASGYSMEVGTCPEMLSPCADRSRLRPFKAGQGSFHDILYDPEAITCLSHPSAAKFHADIVADILDRYPALDGLDFHIGHAFPGKKLCHCPQCKGLAGNRELVYRCFAKVYEAAVSRKPDIRMKTAVKMFGDATRKIVEHYEEFPRLEFFCWFRWLGNLLIEQTEAPVTIGHEDGGGGLEANHNPKKTLTMIRDYFRDYEPWIWTYVQIAGKAALGSISWESALQKEMENQFFLYSQLTWEPDLSWGEFARRFVIRSERKQDAKLTEAYRLALESNAAVTSWGLMTELGVAQDVVQTKGLLGTTLVREKTAALQEMLVSMNIAECNRAEPPAFFDLRWSLAKTLARLQAGAVLGQWH